MAVKVYLCSSDSFNMKKNNISSKKFDFINTFLSTHTSVFAYV